MTSANQVRRTWGALLVMVLSLAAYTFADLASKEWALDNLSRARTGESVPVCEADKNGYTHMQRIPSQPKTFIDGYIVLHYAENCGAAFSMLRTAPSWVRALVFGVAALGACIVLTTMFVKGSGGPLFAASVPFILSGAIGNFSDRIRHGFVVDFIQVDPRLFEYPVFNVADIAIAIGVGLMLIDGIKKPSASTQVTDDNGAPPTEHRA